VRTAAAQSARFGQWADSLGVGDLAFAVLWQRLGQLAVDYVHAPMVPVFTDLVSLRDDVFELLAAPDPAQARDLYLLAGTTCGLLAHASGNLGHLRAAHTQACAALICARKADHPTLAAWVLGVRALQSEWTGQPDESLRFASQAQSQAAREQLTSTVPAWLAAIEARALARRGNRGEALAALQRAADNRSRVLGLLGYRNEFDQVGGILTFTEVKQHYYAGRTLLRIGEFSAAQSHAQLAITGYAAGPADQRSYGDEVITWADLALARVSGAVPDLEGAAEALAVIREQPADRCLPTLLGPLRDLSVALSEPWVRDTRQAAEMRGLITDIATACQRPAVEVEA